MTELQILSVIDFVQHQWRNWKQYVERIVSDKIPLLPKNVKYQAKAVDA